MDHYDNRILQLLSGNSRITGADIARKVNLSLPAVTERLRKLDRSGYIDRYTIKMNRQKLGITILAFIQVWIDHSKGATNLDVITALHEVLECHHVAGDYDLLLKVVVKDTAALEELLVKKIKGIKSVTRTSTTIILSTYKEEINIKNF